MKRQIKLFRNAGLLHICNPLSAIMGTRELDGFKAAIEGDTSMIQENPQIDLFKQQLRDSLRNETLNSRAITIAKNNHAYTCGDSDEMVYFIESGQIKLLMLSSESRECLLAAINSKAVIMAQHHVEPLLLPIITWL